MPDANILPISLAQPEFRVGDAVRCNLTGTDGVVVARQCSEVTGHVIRVLVQFPALLSWREPGKLTRVPRRIRAMPRMAAGEVISGFEIVAKPVPAPDVPVGSPWAFLDHRTVAELEAAAATKATRADDYFSMPAPVVPMADDMPSPRFFGLWILGTCALGALWFAAVLAGLV